MASSSQVPEGLRAENLEVGYDGRPIMAGIEFRVNPAEIFFVMGGSGSGKSTLLKTLIGLLEPVSGRVYHGDTDFTAAGERERAGLLRGMGVLYQGAALFSSLTVLENVEVPLRFGTGLPLAERLEIARRKLHQVNLAEAGHRYPHELSGGMRKRAGLARALALDPRTIFLDEPSAGLDPVSSRQLDDLIASLRDDTGSAVVIVSHELPSIFQLANRAVYLDATSRHQLEIGDPRVMKNESPHACIRAFLRRESEGPP